MAIIGNLVPNPIPVSGTFRYLSAVLVSTSGASSALSTSTLVVNAGEVFRGTINGGMTATNNPNNISLRLRTGAGGAVLGGITQPLYNSFPCGCSQYVELPAGTYFLECDVGGATGTYTTTFMGARYTNS